VLIMNMGNGREGGSVSSEAAAGTMIYWNFAQGSSSFPDGTVMMRLAVK
jgi:hypothetical protein